MPAVIPVHTAIRNTLKDSVQHAIALDDRLERLIADRPSRPPGNFHGKIDFSQPPWHAPVAHAHLDLHALSRKLEKELRSDLGLPGRHRGGSTANTRSALESLCRLAEGADDYIVRLCSKELEKWSRRAKIALEETEIPRRLPRMPGAPEPKCPFCGNHTLRSRALEGKIYCINPGCKDPGGGRPSAHMEYSPIAADWVIVWSDGIAGLPA